MTRAVAAGRFVHVPKRPDSGCVFCRLGVAGDISHGSPGGSSFPCPRFAGRKRYGRCDVCLRVAPARAVDHCALDRGVQCHRLEQRHSAGGTFAGRYRFAASRDPSNPAVWDCPGDEHGCRQHGGPPLGADGPVALESLVPRRRLRANDAELVQCRFGGVLAALPRHPSHRTGNDAIVSD